MNAKVTFVSDYFVLMTTVDDDGIADLEDGTWDEAIAQRADELVRRETGFSPLRFANDYEIEEVSL